MCLHLILSKGLIPGPHAGGSDFSLEWGLGACTREILGRALLETPGGIVRCSENVGDPPPPLLLADPCGHERGGDRVVLLTCSTMGRCYPLLVRL